MPSLLLHVAVIQRLAGSSAEGLPTAIARALREDVEYARLGAFLPELAWLGGLRAGVALLGGRGEPPRFAQLFHDKAPVFMGLKMAELVAMGALVGTEAGLAFVSGYFTHLCMDRVLHPLAQKLAARYRHANEAPLDACWRIERMQGYLYLCEQLGHDPLGTAEVRGLLRVFKRSTPARGMGRGLYELLRVSAHETLGEAPSKGEVDSWVRGLYLHSWVLSSPLGAGAFATARSSLPRRELYQGEAVDFPAEVERALALARQVLQRVGEYVERGRFTERSRERFLEEVPEGSPGACAV